MKRYVLVFASVLRTHSIGLKLTKKVGSIISTKVVEVLKTGVKVAVDPEQKIVVMIKKNQLAIEPARLQARNIFCGKYYGGRTN